VPEPTAAPLCVLDPHAVYDLERATAALGLAETSLQREIRAGRLRACKRRGKYFLLGSQLLAWLQGGELPRRRAVELNGGAGSKT
jgi:hypothetical protein